VYWTPEHTPIVLWAEGCFGQPAGKTASGVIRYGHWPVVAVIDSTRTGQTIQQVIPDIPIDAPIVASLQEALTYHPAVLMIGTAPPGGALPDDCRHTVRHAIQQGLGVISGLHVFLHDDPELVALAAQHQVKLWDVRQWPRQNVITRHLPRPQSNRVITFMGSDCAIGKMVSALELHRAAQQAGKRSHFVATGQTGMMIDGQGLPLDSLVADFAAGSMEAETARYYQPDTPGWIWVEGQGSLLHPAYSGVTLALLHGSCPDGMILCHRAGDTHVRHYTVPIPPLPEVIALVEQVCNASRPKGMAPARVLGIAANTSQLTPLAADTWCQQIRVETGLPVNDPVRHGVTNLWQACQLALG
jgi:uncharacterized NAD-dependent epimerase/dehydratase family protein